MLRQRDWRKGSGLVARGCFSDSGAGSINDISTAASKGIVNIEIWFVRI